jgi:hypothetical protein
VTLHQLTIRWRIVALTLAATIAGRGVAWACPVCFGASDSLMAEGMNAGIFVLLGVTATILATIAVVGWRIAGRARGQARFEGPAPSQGEA